MKTRRQFLSRTAAAAVGTALIPTAMASRRVRRALAPESELSYATFAQLLDTSFRIRNLAGGPVRLRLIDAQLHSEDGGECFTLTLLGPAGDILSQDTYEFEHAHLGRFQMFIVPGAPSTRDPQYFATFNRCA